MLKRCGIAGDLPADNVRIHAATADLLANLVHNQQIDFIQRQAWHQQSSSFKQFLLLAGNNLGTEHFYLRRLVMLILEYRNAAKYANVLESNLGKLPNHSFVADMSGSPVCIGSSDLLAETDGQHLLDSTAQRAMKIGVRLDAIDDHNPIGSKRGSTEDDLPPARSRADLLHLHVGIDRDTEAFRSNPVFGEDLCLALRRGPTMTAHRRYHKRLRTRSNQHADCSFHNFFEICDATAANPNGNPHSGRYSAVQCLLVEFLAKDPVEIEPGRSRISLPDLDHFRHGVTHRGSARPIYTSPRAPANVGSK